MTRAYGRLAPARRLHRPARINGEVICAGCILRTPWPCVTARVVYTRNEINHFDHLLV